MVVQHVPETESKVEPIRDNDQNFLCSCTEKNKMAAISIVFVPLFDWNQSFYFFVYPNTEALKLRHLDLITARFLGDSAFPNRPGKVV